jgi:hypothetical protein
MNSGRCHACGIFDAHIQGEFKGGCQMQAILEEQHVREQPRPGASAHNERAGSALEYTNVYGLN